MAWRLLGDSMMRGPAWGQTFLHYMHSDLLSPEEKAELTFGCMTATRAYEATVMEMDGGAEALPEEWVLFPWMERPSDAVRYAAVWMVELGRWSPAEGVEYCLGKLDREAEDVSRTSYCYRWGEGAGDILLGWRGQFDEDQLRDYVKKLCRNSQFRVRRMGYRCGVIFFGQPFAKPALKDDAKRLREAADVWVSKGAVDKPPVGLKGMAPYPRG